jgi:hydroxyacylglutathione hydrolase
MLVLPIACLKDNYAYLLHQQGESAAVVIDPGDSADVIAALEERELRLSSVLLTHHHWDHTSGVAGLVERYGAAVYAQEADAARLDLSVVPVRDGQRLQTVVGGIEVLHVPGHTLGSASYLWQRELFTGDTLFGGGCGRLFEGTAEQMYTSLMRLARLAFDTRVYSGHEYTLQNLAFAAAVEPENAAVSRRIALVQALRQQGLPSVPSSIELELLTNPFLHCKSAAEFAEVRRRKDTFQA